MCTKLKRRMLSNEVFVNVSDTEFTFIVKFPSLSFDLGYRNTLGLFLLDVTKRIARDLTVNHSSILGGEGEETCNEGKYSYVLYCGYGEGYQTEVVHALRNVGEPISTTHDLALSEDRVVRLLMLALGIGEDKWATYVSRVEVVDSRKWTDLADVGRKRKRGSD